MLVRLLEVYKIWNGVTRHIPKMRRYSLGVKIDSLMVELAELICEAQFCAPSDKLPILSRAILKNDVLKFMLLALHELDGLEEKYFLDLSGRMEEIGRLLYGWKQKVARENIPAKGGDEKHARVTTSTTR